TLRHNLQTLCDRLREDYQLDLAELYGKVTAAPTVEGTPAEGAAPAPGAAALAEVLAGNAPEANEEIDELRRKLSRLGSVNPDSLQELTELEARAGTLQAQFDDLAAAKKALQEIIDKINHDSRRLFTDVFTTIRTHFQELFRKMFGGGMADIILED